MRTVWPWLMMAMFATGAPTDEFVAAAKATHGEPGERAATFLAANLPPQDRDSLTAAFLTENLNLAFQARAQFPWAKAVPEELFHNDVVPYAVFDETREAWRADFLAKASTLVKDAKTASEAAMALNRGFFNLVNVHYDTSRARPNQSPRASIASGKASCTGLAILLVDACRAVGIPARAVGTPMWTNQRGNHTWVEIWDGGWHFMGADEADPAGLDRGWFTNDAAKAKADVPEHAIYATSWKRDGLAFPLVWAAGSQVVAGVNVTARYTAAAPSSKAEFAIRLSEGPKQDSRIICRGWLTTVAGRHFQPFETKAGRADRNDLAHVEVIPGERYRLCFEREGRFSETAPLTAKEGETGLDLHVSSLKPVPAAIIALLNGNPNDAELTKEEAERAAQLCYEQLVEQQREGRAKELVEKKITLGDKTMPWLEKTFGNAPADGRSLWISMHGGGNAPAPLNDSQWHNQGQLYTLNEGIYVAPRAPNNTWNLWHEGHIDPMFERLIEDFVALRGVNPDKVFLMGYSAGGDGVWQLAPRMADHFAAAAMMAGHPNEASLLGLRDLPFAAFVGGADAAYDRNKIMAERAAELDRLATADPGGYVHFARIYEGLPHWMSGKDAEAIPWMEKFRRSPWPKKLVWLQDDITHDRFYWLKLPDRTAAKAGQKITALAEGQTLRLDGDVPSKTELRLSDALLDLDEPVEVVVNGRKLPPFKVTRNLATIRKTLEERLDLPVSASAVLVLP